MKILAICGSPRTGNTYSVLKSIQDNYPDIDFKLLELSKMNLEKIIKAVNTLIERIEKGEKDKPEMAMMVPFHIFKYVSTIDKDVMSADYYYEASIP